MLRAALEAAPCRSLRGAPWELREPPSRPGALWSPLRQEGGLPFQPRPWLLVGLAAAWAAECSLSWSQSRSWSCPPAHWEGLRGVSRSARGCPAGLGDSALPTGSVRVFAPPACTCRVAPCVVHIAMPCGGGPLPTSQDDEAAVERVGDTCSGSDDQAQPIPAPRAPLGSR